MDKNKKTLIIGGSAGAAVLVALIVVSIALANRPSALIVRGFINTISDAERIELFDVADDVANGGSIAVSADLDKIASDDVTVQAKLYSNVRDLKSAFEMTVAEDDEAVLQTRVFYNQDRFAFTCPELVDGAYGINIKNLSKNLPGSIFDPDEETDYSLTEEQYEYFMNLRDTARNNANLEHDMMNMNAKYRKLLIEKLVKYSDVGRSSKTITAGGEKIHCTLISLSIDQDALALATQELIDYANNDKELEKLLYRLASNGSFYDDKDEFVDEFYDAIDDIEDSLDDLKDQDIELKVDFYITSSGRRIAQIDAELEADGEDYEVSVILGKNVAKSKEISLTAKDKTTRESYALIYKVEEDSSGRYAAEFRYEETSPIRHYDWDGGDGGSGGSGKNKDLETDKTVIKVEWDRKSGDFKLKFVDEWDEEYVIKGSLLQKGDRYIFVLTNIRADDEVVPYVKSLELTITVDRHDPIPNGAARYKEITKMDAREFKHLVEDIEDGVESLWDEYFDRW